MTDWTLIRRSLSFYARSHLGALLGCFIGTAVLVGALVVGDSVRGSLRDLALARLGKTQVALSANDRFFRAHLADEMAPRLQGSAAPVIQLQGTATVSDASARANRVQVLGVTDTFWGFELKPRVAPALGPDEVILNQPLAEQLRVQPGAVVLLRVAKPSTLSREAPLTPQEDFALALRVTVRTIVSDQEMGRFSLQANQVAPFTAFLSLDWLAKRIQMDGRANLMLVAGNQSTTAPLAEAALRQTWQLADAELTLQPVPETGALELRTRRVFLDPAIVTAATTASPEASGILTYFVNELRVGSKATPYSMVTALNAPPVGSGMRDDEIILNQWLAEDLGAKVSDRLSLSYFVIGASRRLESRTNDFTVHAIIPIAGPAADRTLMPDFPGLEKAESTRDWDSSLPIKLEKIRPKDEDYWKQYRGTPKAFVTLAAGQKMWSNRFGNLTAVRFPANAQSNVLSQALLQSLDPAAIGFSFVPVRQMALAASEQSQDFGQLFLGFSFFLVLAALLLMALLFQFGVEKRAEEIGTLLALGFTAKHVRRLLLGEGAVLALIGAALGVPGGIAYARAMLYGLSTIWRTAVGTSALRYHATGVTLATGMSAGVLVACGTIWLALRKQARQPARELLAEGAEPESKDLGAPKPSRGLWIGWLASALAMLMVGWAGLQHQTANPEMFFMAGTLLLISGLGFAAAFLTAVGTADRTGRPTLASLGLRNATRRRRRSLVTMGLLACGSFLVASIGVFQLDANIDAGRRSSGTGGFGLVGESALPIVQDLNTEEGRQFFGLSSNQLAGVRFVPFRVHEGDDASCLNLNRAQRPRLLGVRPDLLNQRHAFTFAQVADGFSSETPWLLLKKPQPDGSVPAIADAASIQWALGRKVGDTLPYRDEHGREFKIRLVAALANSILQGNLILAEDSFLTHFPSESGYRMFLIDIPSKQPGPVEAMGTVLSRATQDYGLQLMPATRRLAAFNAVQNTYLKTFQVLGGLGLVLGSLGLGVVVLRNVLERRGELALLKSVGFRSRSIKWMVLSEHGALLSLGLFIGIGSALVAVLPSFLAPGTELPARSLGLTLAAIFFSGGLWTWLATQFAVRGNLLEALRNE